MAPRNHSLRTLLCALTLAGCARPAATEAPPSAAAVAATAQWLAGADAELSPRLTTRSVGWVQGPGGETRTLPLPSGYTAIFSRLPPTADGAWEVGLGERDALGVTLEPIAARPARLELDGKRAIFREAWASTDALYVSGSDYVELLLLLRDERAPAEFAWTPRLTNGVAAVRPDGEGGLAFLDRSGAARLRMRRAYALDARGQRRDARLSWDGATIQLALDTRGLAFPVLLDPIVEAAAWTEVPMVPGRMEHEVASFGSKVLLFGGRVAASSPATVQNDTWEWDGTRWTQRFPEVSPPARFGHRLVGIGDKVVLFGGAWGGILFGDTWEWDGTNWTERQPQHRPSPRGQHSMAALGSKVVLFGGIQGTGQSPTNLDDTWEWDGTDWTERHPAHPPSARGYHAMATVGGKAVLFGGSTASGMTNETWEWDGTDWTQRFPAVSPPAKASRMATVGGAALLYSGANPADIWTWNGSVWSKRSATTVPQGMLQPALAGLGDRMVMFGGNSSGVGSFTYDTWEWDGVDWRKRFFPLGRSHAAMATLGSKVVLFGGRFMGGGQALGDTWEWDGEGWTQRFPATKPMPRWGHVMTTLGSKVLLFGGIGPYGSHRDTWEWDGSNWTPRSTSGPNGGEGCLMGTLGTKAVLFRQDQTWQWDGTTWTQLTPAIGPPSRLSGAMANLGGRLFLFGGGLYGPALNDTWEFDGANWAKLTPPTSPPATYRPLMATMGNKVLLFAGTSIWAWDGGTWSELGTASRPLPREESTMAALGDSLVLFGGLSSYGSIGTLFDTWVYRVARTLGSDCAAAAECLSGLCVDGVCCDGACAGRCEACDLPGLVGTCSPVTGAPRNRTPCASDGSACGGACDGQERRRCTYPATSQSCRPAACSEGIATAEAFCDGAGACPAATPQPCAPFLCGETACAGDCARDEDCVPTHRCSSGVCVAKAEPGAACGAARECLSGHCIDGVCCDGLCAGQCEACDLPGRAGACSPVVGAPRGTRAACASDGSACGGACDGTRRDGCSFPDGSTPCRAPTCSAGLATLAASCDGQGSCPPPRLQTCAPYLCRGDGCAAGCSTAADCLPGHFCSSAGTCAASRGLGEACAAAAECASGHCVDGVCCDGPCTGQCEACGLPGSGGTCALVLGAPQGDRPACAGSGPCGGRCGGERDGCDYPGLETECAPATCSAGARSASATCDGAGRCAPAESGSCGDYACAGTACATSCASEKDCAEGRRCFESRCVAPQDVPVRGCGCGSAGGSPALAFALLASALLRRRRATSAASSPAPSPPAGRR